MRALLALFLLYGPAWGQDVPAQVRDELQRKKGVSAETQRGAEAAKERLPFEGGPDVTYEQVLNSPDDPELNFRYAVSQIRKGNLRSAAATLERVLIVRPDDVRVRLVYGIVLFRLDTLDDAERELRQVLAAKVPDDVRAEVSGFLTEIQRRRRRAHLRLMLGAGLDYDDNRNAAPATGTRLFFNTPITLTEDSTRKSDTAKTMLASVAARYELGYQAGHMLLFDYSYYRVEQTRQRTLNLQNHSVSAGFTFKSELVDVTPIAEFDHLLLTQTTYLRSHGGRLKLERRLHPRLSLSLDGAYARQGYNRTLVVPTGDERTGDKYDGSVSATFLLTPTMSLSGGFTHTHQGAAAKYNAYVRETMTLGHTWLLGKGRFLATTAAATLDHYQRAEAAISPERRVDHGYRGRLSLGQPMGMFWKPLDDFLLTLTYEYYHSLSNLSNYGYTNNKISSLLTYKFDL